MSTKRREIFSGRIVQLGIETATLPNGRTVDLEVIRHPGASAVVPLHADQTVTLVHQYRHAGGGMHYEVPAGVLEAGEAPALCAARELSEEVQLRAARLIPLSTIHTTPGFTDERIHLFLGLDLQPTSDAPEDDEYIRVVRMPLQEALSMTQDGRITDAKTICALHLAARHTPATESRPSAEDCPSRLAHDPDAA
ncbi:MAG: ADP-ribose pyrophosphatase [Deltaproteobacteria bacterium]|nr:ADP-ribose pyrophosphatase [Deltaproteobacteria bacterium]